MFLKVCRAFHKLPDEVRAVNVKDYFAMLESIGEVPMIDDAFFYAFCKGSEKKKKMDLIVIWSMLLCTLPGSSG